MNLSGSIAALLPVPSTDSPHIAPKPDCLVLHAATRCAHGPHAKSIGKGRLGERSGKASSGRPKNGLSARYGCIPKAASVVLRRRADEKQRVQCVFSVAAKNGLSGFSDEDLRKLWVQISSVDGKRHLFTLLVNQCFRLTDGRLSLSPFLGIDRINSQSHAHGMGNPVMKSATSKKSRSMLPRGAIARAHPIATRTTSWRNSTVTAPRSLL